MKLASVLLLVLISTAAAQLVLSPRLNPDEEIHLRAAESRLEARTISRKAAQVALRAALASEAVAKQEYDHMIRELCEKRGLRQSTCRFDATNMLIERKGRKP